MDQESYKSAIGKIWKRARITKQVKRSFVAEALGVSISAIAKIEQQRYHVTMADMICYCKAIGYCPHLFLQQVLDELPPPRKR